MFNNSGYLENYDKIIPMEHKPLGVSSCGHFKFYDMDKLKTLRPNGRSDWQIIYIASGSGHFHTKNGLVCLTGPCAVLYRPGQRQEYTYNAKDNPDVYWIHFGGNDVENTLASLSLFSGNDIYKKLEAPGIDSLFEKIISQLQLRLPFFAQMCDALFYELLCTLARSVCNKDNKKLSHITEQALLYFNENYQSPLCVGEYAASVSLSHSRFCRIFKSETKKTPTQYLQNIRLNAAKELLSSTDFNVSEVSDRVGYTDPLYFSRLFSRIEGVSPSRYKKVKRN